MKVQLVVARAGVTTIWTQANLNIGDVVWVNEDAAEHLLEHGICKWPSIGPKESKPAGPSELKSSGDRTDGHATVSPLLNQRGEDRLSSVSAADLVSPQRALGAQKIKPV